MTWRARITNIFRQMRRETPSAVELRHESITKGEPMSESFPSLSFARSAEAAAQRLENAKREVETLQERLAKFRRNREALEVSGKNPDDEIARTREEITAGELEVNRAKETLYAIFSEERERYVPTRQALWESSYLPLLTAASAELGALACTLRRMAEELAALKTAPVVGVASISALDFQVAAHNALVKQLGMPSNLAINPQESLSGPFEHGVRRVLAESELPGALRELRQLLGLESQQPKEVLKFGLRS
jgi:HAMP domain-containing protein